MKQILFAVMITALAIGPAMAQETCASKAIDKNGKPLAGAALNSFLKKCKREACLPKAVSAEGKRNSLARPRTASCGNVRGTPERLRQACFHLRPRTRGRLGLLYLIHRTLVMRVGTSRSCPVADSCT